MATLNEVNKPSNQQANNGVGSLELRQEKQNSDESFTKAPTMENNKKPRLYLHIGTPKTGTTAIQNFLPLNKSLLEEQGFCFPDFGYRYQGVGKYRNGHFLVHHSSGGSLEDETEAKRSEDERFVEGLDKIKELTNTYPNIILSDENIWNAYWQRENFWSVLKNALDERKIELKVIVYLRRQDLAIESYWIQRVKYKLHMSFKYYVDSGKCNFFKLDYYKQLEDISKIIGKENIIVRVYEKQQFEGNGNTLISDFLNTLGLELDERYVSADIVANTSLHGSFLETKRLLNIMPYFRTPGWPVKYLRMVQQESEQDYKVPNGEYFTYDRQIAFLEKYKESNELVAREYMNRENGILFKDKIEKRTDTPVQYSAQELVLICGKMIRFINEDNDMKINNLKVRLEEANKKLAEANKRLAYANRPLTKKITSKIRHAIFKNKDV